MPSEADCLRAERAGLVARQGQIAEARSIIAELQAKYSQNPHPKVNAWILLAEGLTSHFSDMAEKAHDKIRRAHAVSAAARDLRLHALASAWLAQMDYNAYDLDAMGRHVAEALQLADADHHSARARVYLVIALAYHFGGCFEAAQPWYAKSRLHASAEGDEAMLSAIMYNMAGLLADQARHAVMTGRGDAAMLRRAELSFQSATNLDALLGIVSLDAIVPLHRARVCTLQSQWAEAISLYEAHFSGGLVQGLDRMRASLGADLAWCRLQLGQTEQGREEALAAQIAVSRDRDANDRAAAHHRLAQVFDRLGQADVAARHREQAAADWQMHEREQALAVAAIEKAVASVG